MSKQLAGYPLAQEKHFKRHKAITDAELSNTESVAEITQSDEASQSDGMVNESGLEDANYAAEASTDPAAKAVDLEKTPKETKKPPVADGFDLYPFDKTAPPPNPFWGIKPLPGGPRPDPVQPSARESGGQTNPPMWENRGFRFKRGTRRVKYFGPLVPDNVHDLGEDCDQEDLLVTRLIDMRIKSRKNPTPKREPTVYSYGRIPKDWNNMQIIKALNDRRYQAIDRITMDAPWTRIEREYLAQLFRETPDASIWDLTELHNERFMDKDYVEDTGFGFASLSTGRTVESVRAEYLTYRVAYDRGAAPPRVRFRNNQSVEGKAIRDANHFERAFGKSDKSLEKAHDAEASDDDDKEGVPNQKKRIPKSKMEAVVDSEDEATPTRTKGKRPAKDDVPVYFERPTKKSKIWLSSGDNSPEELSDLEEEVLELAGAYGPEEDSPIPTSTPDTPIQQPVQVAKDLNMKEEDEATDIDEQKVEAVIKETTIQYIADSGIQFDTEVVTDTNPHIVRTASEEIRVQETAEEDYVEEVSALDIETGVCNASTEITTTERRTSVHATRKMEIDETYSDDEGEVEDFLGT